MKTMSPELKRTWYQPNWPVYQENIRKSAQQYNKLFPTNYNISHIAKNQEKNYTVVERRMKITMHDSHHTFNRARKHLTTKNLTEFKKKRGILPRTTTKNKLTKNNKMQSWRSYVLSIISQTTISEIWKKNQTDKWITIFEQYSIPRNR